MKKKRHIFRRLLLLVLLAAALALGWVYVSPLLSDVQTPAYTSYTVERGSIEVSKSFSATISVLNSETLSNTTGASTIREVYVTAGQEVREGDKLMLLSDGELLTAGLDGVVNEMRYGVGSWLRQNAQLIQICDLTNLQVSLSVDEYDVRGVAAGQSCTVTIVPLGVDFETEIAHVNRVSATTGQVAYYTATAELVVPPSVLPGMTASVTIPDQSADDVLVLAMAALSFDEDKSPYVLRKDGESYAKVPVVTGLSDGMQVEIVSGLSEGDTVWVQSGTETVTSALSLTEIYKKIFGEKIVINDMSGSSGRSRTDRNSFSMPDGFSVSEGFTRPDGVATPGDMPGSTGGGFTIPDGFSMPEGFTRPDGVATPGDMPGSTGGGFTMPDGFSMPEGFTMPQGSATSGDTPSGTTGGFSMPEGFTRPDGVATPGDMPQGESGMPTRQQDGTAPGGSRQPRSDSNTNAESTAEPEATQRPNQERKDRP